MNFRKNITYFVIALLSWVAVAACSDDNEVETVGGKGYFQLRLSTMDAVATRAIGDMSNAKKVMVTLDCNGLSVVQTLNLQAVTGAEGSGLSTETLELAPGGYKLTGYVVYGSVKPGKEQPDELLQAYPESNNDFEIVSGHLTELELTVNATTRGNVCFNLIRDMSNYQDQMDAANTRAAIQQDETDFQYDNMQSIDVTYTRKGQMPRTQEFALYRKRSESEFHTDTVNWETGEYTITEVKYYDKNRQHLVLVTYPNQTIKIEPTLLNHRDINVTYPKNMKAINDYITLYNLCVALDVENWSFSGDEFPAKSNWRFKNRNIDEWGNQPGVQLDNNGRVKTLNLGGFNPKGDIPEILGNLDQLESLWVGTHNDTGSEGGNSYVINPYQLYTQGVLKTKRLEIGREQLALRHARKQSDLYEKKNQQRFTYAQPATYDLDKGSHTNHVTSLPHSIGKLQQLEYLYVANGDVSDLPIELADLPNLTDVEFYNCPFKRFPEALTKMKNIVAINLSNTTIEGDEGSLQLTEGINQMVKNNPDLQIMYATGCSLTKFPMDILDHDRLVLLDFSDNRLTYLPEKPGAIFKPAFAPIQAFFENNRITGIDEHFCGTDDVEKFVCSNNLIEKFPLLFNQTAIEGIYVADDIDFGYNKISSMEGFMGIRTNTLTLSGNPIGERRAGKGNTRFFPSAFAKAVDEGRYPHRVYFEFLEMADCSVDSLSYEDGFKYFNHVTAWDLSGNPLRGLPSQFNVKTLPYLNGLSLSYCAFTQMPTALVGVMSLYKLYMEGQFSRKDGSRCFKEFPTALNSMFALRYLDFSGNDLRVVPENNFPTLLFEFNLSDNPNIEVNMPASVCTKIANGQYAFGFDSSQYILGCAILDLDMNK